MSCVNEQQNVLFQKKVHLGIDEISVSLNKPKRPLSAYNMFFRCERSRILKDVEDDRATIRINVDKSVDVIYEKEGSHLYTNHSPEDIRRKLNDIGKAASKRRNRKTHGKISFVGLIKYMSKSWSKLDANSREAFEILASEEKKKYFAELKKYKKAKHMIAKRKRSNIKKTASINNFIKTTTILSNDSPKLVYPESIFSHYKKEDSRQTACETLKTPLSSHSEADVNSSQINYCYNTHRSSTLKDNQRSEKHRSLSAEEIDLAKFLLDFDWENF